MCKTGTTKLSQTHPGLKTEQSHLPLCEQLYFIVSLFFMGNQSHLEREEAQSALSLLC